MKVSGKTEYVLGGIFAALAGDFAVGPKGISTAIVAYVAMYFLLLSVIKNHFPVPKDPPADVDGEQLRRRA